MYVRIVCAHDAVITATAIKRLLNAEGFIAEIAHGRGSLAQLEDSCVRREAVLLIWSLDAPTTDYMYKWAAAADPVRLAEIARAPIWPPLEGRRANVVDFSDWSGERGGPAWRALEDRLRHIARALEPRRSAPFGPAVALVGASIMAAAGAFMVRMQQVEPMQPVHFEQTHMAETQSAEGLGGPLIPLEPESLGEGEEVAQLARVRGAARLIDGVEFGRLINVETVEPLRYRDANLLDRLSDWTAPLTSQPALRETGDPVY